jgi:uncharacterized protein
MELTQAEKRILLNAARESLQAMFANINPIKPDYKMHPSLNLNVGAFVTLTIEKDLRGCIGYVMSPMNLYETIWTVAQQAAKNDPRFYPVTEEELDKIEIEISVLSPPVLIKTFDEIIIGIHGLLLDDNGFKSILLPQVAVKNHYNIEQFLEALCQKAGCDKQAWKTNLLNINIFSAIIFSETDLKEDGYEQN